MNVLENYHVISIIGNGNFSTCYRVCDKKTNKIYAAKAIEYNEFSEINKKNLTSEIQLLRQLNHQNIVQYINHILNYETKTIFIIMEYCEGGDLAKLIKKCNRENLKFDEKYIWRVLMQLCEALQFCHHNITDQIILHRDIKPANIFLDLQGNIKLGDFGLARILNRNLDEFADTIVGTPYYMSPEIVRGRKYNRKSDIWAIGCVIYEMCALKPPFNGQIFNQLSQNITNGQYSCIPKYYSKDLLEIISIMLVVNSDCRPSVEIILKHSILEKNTVELNYEYPNLLPSESLNKQRKLDFSPNLSSSILTHFSINDDDMNGSNSRISGVDTPKLRAELFECSKINNFTISNLEFNETKRDIKIKDSKYLVNYCPNDPEMLTSNIFDAELKRRLQMLRAQESLLMQKNANLLTKEKQLNERERRIIKTEKQLEAQKLHLDHLLKQESDVMKSKKSTKIKPISLDDTYCSIDSADIILEPTVAKLNLPVMPLVKNISNKTVAFNSPKKFVSYNIENIPSLDRKMKSSSLRIENNLSKNKMNNFSSSLSSENSVQSNKRKSILSIFGININKSSVKCEKVINSKFNKENLENQNNEKKEIIHSLETTNLGKRWTTENKKAAFQLLATMNNEDTKKNMKLSHTWRSSVREITALQRNKQRRSMTTNSNKNILM